MSRVRPNSDRPARNATRKRALRPVPEVLEGRLLLYSQLGDQFVYSSRITYSFMPDGTSVGGVPSALFSTLNAKFATAIWQQQIEQGAAIWENAANLNLALVSDGGQPVGTAGQPAGRLAVRRYPHRCRAARRRHAGRDVSAPAGQRWHRRRRHPAQLEHQLADQLELRPDDRRRSRVWPCARARRRFGPELLVRRHVRHLQRHQTGARR